MDPQNNNVETLKDEISREYVKIFKKQLWWIKSLAVLPIEKNIKDILTWKRELPENFDETKEFWWWWKIVNFVSPKTANEIFAFMKEKRLEIESRKTEEELVRLRTEVLWWTVLDESHEVVDGENETPSNNQWDTTEWEQSEWNADLLTDTAGQSSEQQGGEDWEQTRWNYNAEIAIGTAVWWVVAVERAKVKLKNNADARLAENMTADDIRGSINKSIDALKKQTENTRLTSKQTKTINKHIAKLEEGLQDAWDEELKLIKAWNEIDYKLPKSLLKEAGLYPEAIKRLEDISWELMWKSVDEMKLILKDKNIVVNDDVLKALSQAGDLSEFKRMTKILRHGSKINRLLQTIAWAMVIDVACLWLDVWVYLETMDEAALIAKVNEVRAENKRNQAAWQLGIWVASVAIEGLLIWAFAAAWSAGWPVGTLIGLWVWALTMAVSMGIDSLYFDVQDFYKQNKEDFIRQKRSQVNQAILQWIHNKKAWDVSLNEKWWAPDPETKLQSLHDACWSMMFLDEIQDGKFRADEQLWNYLYSWDSKETYVNKLPTDQKKEFEEKWTEVDSQIWKRMEYVEKVFQWDRIMKAIKDGKWMETLNKVITESKVYVKLQEEDKWSDNKNYDEILQEYKEDFFADIPEEKVQKLEKLREENPYLFQEVITTVNESQFLDEEETDVTYATNVKAVEKYSEWVNLTRTDAEKFSLEVYDEYRNGSFIESLLRSDFDLSKVDFPNNNENEVKYLIGRNLERRWLMEISDSTKQNILYRLAKELYWYKWWNTSEELISFYDEGSWDTHGIYYSSKWKMNNDWWIDGEMEWSEKSDGSLKTEEDVDSYINIFMLRNVNWYGNDNIDTKTESIDDDLQKEFETNLRRIMKEELIARLPKNKEKVKNEIIEFVKNTSKDWGYVELPYYLLLKAKKAWLWDLQKSFFRWKKTPIIWIDFWRLEICTMQSEIHKGNLWADINYLTPKREDFTEEEQYYIDRVERAHTQLSALRSEVWNFTIPLIVTDIEFQQFDDELDLPKEIEVLIWNKYKEWEKFKIDLKTYDPDVVAWTVEIMEKYREFAEYFENLYRWILLSQTTFSGSNDIDTYAYFSQAVSFWNMNYFSEKWELLENERLDFFKDDGLKSFYNEQIWTQKIDWKTIKELWNSDDRQEKDIARQASNMIITTILEHGILEYDEKWRVSAIDIGTWDWKEGYTDNKEATIEAIRKKCAKMHFPPEIKEDKIRDLCINEQEIKSLTEEQQEIVVWIPELQKKIEETKDDIIWQDRRWDIFYNPETSTIRSRWNEIKVSEEKDGHETWFYLEWLDVPLCIDEVAFVANLRNWAVSWLAWEKIVHGYTRTTAWWWGRRKWLLKKTSRSHKDIMILADNDLTWKHWVSMDDKDIDKLAEWLNYEV